MNDSLRQAAIALMPIGLVAGVAMAALAADRWTARRLERRRRDRALRRAMDAVERGCCVTADMVYRQDAEMGVASFACGKAGCRHETAQGANFCALARHYMSGGEVMA